MENGAAQKANYQGTHLICYSKIHAPKEILSLTWGDVKLRQEEMEGMYGSNKKSTELVSVIQIDENQKTGKRVVVCIAGNYFKRLREYYKEEFNYEPKNTDPVLKCLVEESVLDRYTLSYLG